MYLINIKIIKTSNEEFDSKLHSRMVEGDGEVKGREADGEVIGKGCMKGRQWMEPGMVNCIQNVKVVNKSCSKLKFTLRAMKFWSIKIIKKLKIIYPGIPKNQIICGPEWGLHENKSLHLFYYHHT